MKVLVVGSGGREHALCAALAKSPKVDSVFCAPGNGGIAAIADCRPDLLGSDLDGLVTFAKDGGVDLTVVGPEAPLVAGIVDRFQEEGLRIFGPSKAAAQLEGSKDFAKQIMLKNNVPTAAHRTFTEHAEAREHIEPSDVFPVVVTADGLAAGKGVTICETKQTALEALEEAMGARRFGDAGSKVVVEEFLRGEEASVHAITDGDTLLVLPSSQDHKRVGEGDTGPNTGGMGAYSPAPIMTEAVCEATLAQIVRPTMAEMARRGTPYTGVLYVGLMIADGQPRLVEYNVRFGDPECQALMMRLGAQALDLMLAAAEGRLGERQVNWAEDHAMTVVLAADGYPGAYEKGTVIGELEALPETSWEMMFHAGTSLQDGKVLASGGRVLNATARGRDLREARERAYAMAEAVDWPGGFFRRDIGWRALDGSGRDA